MAVSKLKPATDILALHQGSDGTKGHVHFGGGELRPGVD